MKEMEGEGSSEMDCTVIETAADSLDGSVIFHAINEISGFVLYMHQQIPSMLQDISFEYDTLCTDYKDLEMGRVEIQEKASLQRKHGSKMREVKQGIRRLEKLMRAVSDFQNAVKLVINEVPNIQGVILVLGASPLRPQHVYDLCFSHGMLPNGAQDFTKSRAAEVLSRKAIRALISKGAGSGSYPGTSKLFLLVKAPSSFNLPLHFLPKRDFRYSKKIVPFRVQFKCRTQSGPEMDAADLASQTGSSIGLVQSTENEFIWYESMDALKFWKNEVLFCVYYLSLLGASPICSSMLPDDFSSTNVAVPMSACN